MRHRHDDIFAGILVGGQGRRLGGVDKARLIAANGKTFAQDMLARVTPWVHSVIIAGRQEQAVDYPQQPYVADTHQNAGPLGGLHALLQKAPTPWCWLIAVDMPALDGELLGCLAEARSHDSGSAIIAPHSPWGLEPCAALYHRRLLDPIGQQLATHTYALRAFIQNTPHTRVPVTAAPMRNVNQWSDLEPV